MAEIVARNGNELTLQVTVRLTGSLRDRENTLLDSCNEMGCLATTEALQRFDTDGSPIKLGDTKMTARSKDNKTYQTPYGSVDVERYVYQSSKGGRIYCPLEQHARIIRSATPKFAQQISHKYANMNAPSVCQDLADNHHRKIAHSYLQDVSDCVGSIAQAKEEVWGYTTPALDEAITMVVVSLDGAYVLMRDEGYREAMVGNISLYAVTGERLHTIYIGDAPEYGKGTFFQRLEKEIATVKTLLMLFRYSPLLQQVYILREVMSSIFNKPLTKTQAVIELEAWIKRVFVSSMILNRHYQTLPFGQIGQYRLCTL